MNMEPNDKTNISFKQNFEDKYSKYKSQRKPWTQERIQEVINNIQNARATMSSNTRKTSMEYYWLNKYDIMTVGSKNRLIFKKKSPGDQTIQIIPYEEYFNIIMKIHKNCGHGGRDKTLQDIKTKYYIPKKAIEIFVSLCPTCDNKRNVPRKEIVICPNVLQDFNIRGHIDLIDFQSCTDGEFRWLLNYQDTATRFVSLRPLKTKKANEIAAELLKIFLIFGAPYILQSDNDQEFTAQVIREVMSIWPDCKIVNGSNEGLQIQSNIEHSKPDIENMLRIWMTENKTFNWSAGCFFVQYQINASYHEIIGRSPFNALFGCDPKAGLNDSDIPYTLLMHINTEEQLKNLSESDQQFSKYCEPSGNCDLQSESPLDNPDNPNPSSSMDIDASCSSK